MAVAVVRPGTLHAWKGPSLLVADRRGARGDHEPLSGYYFRETRFARTLGLEVNGEPPWLCEAASLSASTLAFTDAYPEIAEYGGGGSGQSGDEVPTNQHGIPQRALAIRLSYRTLCDGLAIAITIANHSRQTDGPTPKCSKAAALFASFNSRRQNHSPPALETGSTRCSTRSSISH